MLKIVLLATFLVLASLEAVAAPRTLMPAESRIGFMVKEMGVPVPGETAGTTAR